MRLLRPTWILVTNGLAVHFFYKSTSQVVLLNKLLEQDNGNKAFWIRFALWVTIPILGILLEFLGSRFAKWLNVGYFVFLGAVFSAVGIWNWADRYGIIVLGLVALAFAGSDWVLYRAPSRIPGTSPT
jgi:hypothetical protein